MSAPADVLLRITTRRRERVMAETLATDGAGVAVKLADGAPLTPAENAFLGALAARKERGLPAIIAEVKMGSPRLGSLAGRLDPTVQAETYAAHGATALSVVVEPDFFHGGYELLAACRHASGLPAIAKDFIVDPVQLVWAKEAGADAILLIAALYEPDELLCYAGQARGLGLVPLIETHTREDVAKLTGSPWELVGVNNRNLRTFEVDLGASIALLPDLPPMALKVAESGIDGRAAVDRLHAAGFDAFLIGESLLLAENPAAKLEELAG
ncbi:MAG: indole-3-glycerol phosphate synthase [Acidobacteriota bacterium]|jgi:indole-3-glycerol phosphate synthase|nr:indole-3-glycerol phosphate synthase [Acidobacteriota bacterium]